jgi:hypothetical protein
MSERKQINALFDNLIETQIDADKGPDNDYDLGEISENLKARLGGTEALIARLANLCKPGGQINISDSLRKTIEKELPNLAYFRSDYLIDFHLQRNDRQRKIHVPRLQGQTGVQQLSLFRTDGIWVLAENKRVRHIETNRQQLLTVKDYALDEYARLRQGIDKSEREIVEYVDSRTNVWPSQIKLLAELETRFFGFSKP